VSAFVDTNVLIRHLTGDPPEMAIRATAFLGSETDLLLADLVVAETVYVLESFYEAPRPQISRSVRSLLRLKSVVCVDAPLLRRAVEIYEPIDSTSLRRISSQALKAQASTGSCRSIDRSTVSAPLNASNRGTSDGQ